MKKFAIVCLAVFTFASATYALPRTGFVGYTDGGLGLFMDGGDFTARVTYQSHSEMNAKLAKLGFAANWRFVRENASALFIGVGYSSNTGNDAGVEYDKNSSFSVRLGAERSLTQNLLFTAELDVYSSALFNLKGARDSKETNLFNAGRMGLVYFF